MVSATDTTRKVVGTVCGGEVVTCGDGGGWYMYM